MDVWRGLLIDAFAIAAMVVLPFSLIFATVFLAAKMHLPGHRHR